jgi:hypothetical protein
MMATGLLGTFVACGATDKAEQGQLSVNESPLYTLTAKAWDPKKPIPVCFVNKSPGMGSKLSEADVQWS